jgi:NAD(P)-dependent dehydrogenase (short-subunit alcohol dehydrogenase family)
VKTIHHVLDIDAGVPAAWAALTTGAGLAGWWSCQVSVEETGAGTRVSFVFDGDFNPVMQVTGAEEGRRLVWRCAGGHGNWQGFPATSVYNAVKAGVRALGRTFAAELAPRGIRVNTVSPGLTETPMAIGDPGLPPGHRDEAARQQLALIPLRRLGRPEEIATTILFLASDDASFYTGADLTPDGGTRDI